jgi:ABC-type amino acid transport substrate-binding protein
MLIRVSTLILVTAAFLCSSCSRAGNSDIAATNDRTESVLTRIKSERVIRAGVIPYPPFVIKDPNTNQYSGYFVELMDHIATFMGDRDHPITIQYEETTWAGMITGLKEDRFDIIVSGVFRTIPRAMEVTWPRPCMYVGMSALVRADDNRFKLPADLQAEGIRVAVAAGEVGHDYQQRFLPHSTPIVLQTADTAATALEVSSGNADVAIAESVALVQYAKQHPEVKVLFVEKPLFTYATSVMIRRGDPEWLDFLNISIEFLQLAGITEQLDRKYNPAGEHWLSPAKAWESKQSYAGRQD